MKSVMAVSLLCSVGFGEARFPMQYVDEVGHLGNPYSDEKRTAVDVGMAKIRADGDGGLVVEGEKWMVRIEQKGGVGWTTVWSADFDGNGRRDLLFAGYFPGNGRCVNNGVEVSVLLFREDGVPEVWELRTMLPDLTRFPYVPILVRDLDGDGRAEFVTILCERVDPPEGFGERYEVDGVFEARDGRLAPLVGTDVGAYAKVARRALGSRLRTSARSNWQEVRRRAVTLRGRGGLD